MKKVLTLLICFALTNYSFAQEKKFSWGVKASYNLSSSLDATMKSGFNAGVLGEYRFNKLVALSPELLFSLQRYKSEGDPCDILRYYNLLCLPIMVKFYVTKKLSLDVGPQFGYILSSGCNHNEDCRCFEFSMGFGATYNFSRFFASARYNISASTNHDESLNTVIQAGIGYKF